MTTTPHGRTGGTRASSSGSGYASRTAPDAPALRVQGPAELIDAVPYLLGFRPRLSLVLVGLHRTVLVVTARIDLTELVGAGGRALLAQTVSAMALGGSSTVVAVVYAEHDDARAGTSGPASRPYADTVAVLDEVCAEQGVDLLDAVLCGADRWWSYGCDVPSCCPPGGQQLSVGSRVAAEATYAGLVALPDRSALEQVVEPWPDDPAAVEALDRALAAAERAASRDAATGTLDRRQRAIKRELFAAARRAGAVDLDRSRSDAPTPPADLLPLPAVARFAVALRSIAVRDPVWMAIDDGRLDGRPLWRELACRLPAPYRAAPLFLFGWRSWRAGNGALAGMAAVRAVESDPGYSAADLLLAALERGVDPRRLPRLRLPRSA